MAMCLQCDKREKNWFFQFHYNRGSDHVKLHTDNTRYADFNILFNTNLADNWKGKIDEMPKFAFIRLQL